MIDWKKSIHIPVAVLSHLPWVAGIGAFLLIGVVKPYLDGPIPGLTTIYRPKPVPVKVETVKWLTRVEKERVNVPVEVIREVPAKVEKHLQDDFKISLPELRAEHKALVDVVNVPKAPDGGEMALTLNTETGKVDSIFRPKPMPFFQLGGIREAGVGYDPLQQAAVGFYRQDLARTGPIVWSGEAYVKGGIAPAARTAPAVGVEIRASIRF